MEHLTKNWTLDYIRTWWTEGAKPAKTWGYAYYLEREGVPVFSLN